MVRGVDGERGERERDVRREAERVVPRRKARREMAEGEVEELVVVGEEGEEGGE